MRILLSTLAIWFLTSPSSLYASLFVFQTAEPMSANAFVEHQGNVGDRLDLRCDVTAGACLWRVTTQLWVQDGTSTSYDLRLWDAAGSESTLSVSDTSTAGAPYPFVNVLWENMNGFLSVINAHTQVSIPASPNIHFMHSYVLTQASADLGTFAFIKAGTEGFSGFEPGDPGDPIRRVQFAANPAIQFPEWPNPVIRINNVPEPASLSLLACGLALLGRRKNRRLESTV